MRAADMDTRLATSGRPAGLTGHATARRPRPLEKCKTAKSQKFLGLISCVYGIVHKAFVPAIAGMSGQIHADFLWLLWVLADKQMRSYYESMGKEDKIRHETF